MRGNRALILSEHYAPELIGSGPYIADLAEHMARHGFVVDVVTNRPNYPTNSVQPDYRDGKRDREVIQGVSVHRMPPHLPGNRGAFGRLMSAGVFLLRGLFLSWRMRGWRVNVIVSLCPSIFTVLLGWLVAGRRSTHVALVHDIQSGLAAGLNILGEGHAVRALRTLERFAFNHVDMVFVLSEPMARHLRNLGVTSEIRILPIWIDTTETVPQSTSPANVITAMYSGNFGRKQALEGVIDSAGLLQERGSGLRIVLQGQGSEEKALKSQAARLGLENVTFLPLAPPEKLSESLAAADIHIVSQHASIADFAVPSKVFTIMAIGRAFIAAAPPGSLLWQLSEQSGAFQCVPSGDPTALTKALEELAANGELRRQMAKNGRAYVARYHDRARTLTSFMELITETMGQRIRNA